MKKKTEFTSIILACLLAASYLSIRHISAYGITNLLWLVIILPCIATFLLPNFVKKHVSIAERIGYSVGLLVAFLIVLGLILNTIGLAIHKPTLVPNLIIPTFDALFCIGLASFLKTRQKISLPTSTLRMIN